MCLCQCALLQIHCKASNMFICIKRACYTLHAFFIRIIIFIRTYDGSWQAIKTSVSQTGIVKQKKSKVKVYLKLKLN